MEIEKKKKKEEKEEILKIREDTISGSVFY